MVCPTNGLRNAARSREMPNLSIFEPSRPISVSSVTTVGPIFGALPSTNCMILIFVRMSAHPSFLNIKIGGVFFLMTKKPFFLFTAVRNHSLATTPPAATGLEEKPWSLEQVVDMTAAYWETK